MSAATIDAFVLRPPRTERYGAGAALALLAHAALVAALAFGVQWRMQSTPLASAELWAEVPRAAAAAAAAPPVRPTPAPAPPVPKAAPPSPREAAPPAPRAADIAAERARAAQRKAEEEAEQRRRALDAAQQEKLRKAAETKAREVAEAKARDAKAAEEKRQRELKEAKAAEAEDRQIAKAREKNLERMLAQAGSADATGSTPGGKAAKDAAPSAEFAGRIKARIKPNIKLLTEVAGNPITEVEVRCAPDGTIIARRIVKASGSAVWDDTVLRAIDATRLLPRDTDGRIPSLMILVFPRQE